MTSVMTLRTGLAHDGLTYAGGLIDSFTVIFVECCLITSKI